MKKGQYFESVIERVDFPNKAVTYAEDRKVIIKNAIPFTSCHVRVPFTIFTNKYIKHKTNVISINNGINFIGYS